MKETMIFDTTADLAQVQQNQKIAVAAVLDALAANMQISVTRLLTPTEADTIAGYSATAKVNSVIAKNAAAAEQDLATYTATVNVTKSINDTKVPIRTALNVFTEGSVEDNEEVRNSAITLLATCVQKYYEEQEALRTLATKEHLANERQELFFTNMYYIMDLYKQLREIANDTTHKYETYDALTGVSTPLITRGNNASTYPDVYKLSDAMATYKLLLGDYRQNENGQFLDQNGAIINFDNTLKVLTGEYVAVDKTTNNYYDRNSSAITVLDTNGALSGFMNRTTKPFDVFDQMVLEQGGSQGLLHDIMRTQEQEDIYNLVKAYDALLSSKYHIRWYRKNPDYNGAPDKYVGYGWEMLNDMTRTFGATTVTTEDIPQLYTDYSLRESNRWYRVFYAGEPSNFNQTYTAVKTGEREDGTPIWKTIQGTPPQAVLDSDDAYFYFATTGTYNWDTNCRWILEDYPTISLNAVVNHTHREFYILPEGANTAIVTCRNNTNAYVYVAGDTQFYPDPDNVKTKLLSDEYQKIVTSYQLTPTEVTHYSTYVERPRPYELFSLNNVELWGKRETTTFKAVITYNGTFITSNEIVFKNKSNAALADLINEFNQRFKLQLIRPIHNAVHETAESGSVFGTKHIADDNVSEFFVFDERGNALENEEGIPYYQVPYYAVLLMKDPEKEDATYEILQYDNAAGQSMDELTLLIGKLTAWGAATDWGLNDNIKDSTAAGYLSATDRTKMAAYCNVESFEEVYTNSDGSKNENKLRKACQSLSDDNPESAYSIEWVTTEQNRQSRELGNRSMFNYCKRLSTEQLNDRFEIGLDTRQRIFALEFKIKQNWSLANNNPTEVISLDINYNGQIFRVERELHFGPGSTMGSEYSVSVVASHATDKSTNSHVLLIDSAHSSGGGICNYYLNAVIRHKGKELTAEERDKMSVYWYLNSGLNDDEYTAASANQMAINGAGTLSIRYKPESGAEVPHPVVPPIVILRVDGLAPYSLYYAQPFQVFCRTGMALNAANPWRVSVPDRVLFRSDGATPMFHDANFTITKVEYAADGVNKISLDPLEWKQINYTPGTHSWDLVITQDDIRTATYRAEGEEPFAVLGGRYMDPQYVYYQKIEGTVPLIENSTTWDQSAAQEFTIHIAAEVTGGHVEVARMVYHCVPGDEYTPTDQGWACVGVMTPEECLDNVAGEYTPTYKLNDQGQAVAPWKLYSRYHESGSLFTDNTTVFSGERVSDVGHEFFMNINDGAPYSAKLDMSHYLCIKHNGALIGEEPTDGSNAYGIPSGEVWSMGFVDGANTQWEERLRDAHTYLECELPDGAWFTSSIVFERSVYCSSLVNSWSGSELILDEETNTVMTQHLVVGSKDSNNTFTGLMMGDWNGKYNDGSIDVPGLYGFRSGAQTFGLLTTGEAFFGAAGSGRIYINKAAGVISNYNMTAYINLNPRKTDKIDKDTYDIRSKGYSPFFLYCEGDYEANSRDGITGPQTNWKDLEDKAKTRDIFAVDPHRGLFMSGGIRCTWGNIGGWEISDAGLTKKKNNSKIYLGIGNDNGATEENLYLYMILQHYLNNNKRGVTGCHDESIIHYYTTHAGSYVNNIRTGMTYIDLLKYADRIWWDHEWNNGSGFAKDSVQRIFLAYQTQVYDAKPNHTPRTAVTYQQDSENAFRADIDAGWLLPFRFLNWLYKIEPITHTDGYITTVNYPLIMDNDATYNVFNYESDIKDLYTKSRQKIAEDQSVTPYLMWAGPAATTMDATSPGVFSVTGDGYLHAEEGNVGGWNLSKRKLYSANNTTTYIYDENGQKLKGEYGDYITTQNGDGNYLIELDTGNKAAEGYNSPYLALLSRSILLESASSGGNGRTYARMGFYYDPQITYAGRMKKRADSSELYYKREQATIEIDVPTYDPQTGQQTGTHKETQYDYDEFGNPKYVYVAKKYKSTGYSYAVQASEAEPTWCGWVETTDNDPDGHYLTAVHYWDAGQGSTPLEYIRFEALDVDGSGSKGVLRYVTGGYNIVIDGNDSENRGSIKLGQCNWNNPATGQVETQPAIEILGTGVIKLHHDNIILDGVNRLVQIGVKGKGNVNEDATVSLVGFALSSRDIDAATVAYSGGPRVYDGYFIDYYVQEYVNSGTYAGAYKCRSNSDLSGDTVYAWPLAAGTNYSAKTRVHILVPYDANEHATIRSTYNEYSTGSTTEDIAEANPGVESIAGIIELTLDIPYQKIDYKIKLEGDYLAFTRYDPNSTPAVSSKGMALLAGTVTEKDLNGNGQLQPLDPNAYEDKTVLVPATYISNGTTLNVSSGGHTGMLLNWDLKGDWVSTGTVYASKGVFGPAGEYASLQYVNEKLAELARQIANLLNRLNGNIADLRRIIMAIAGGKEGLNELLGGHYNPESGQYEGEFGGEEDSLKGRVDDLEGALNTIQKEILDKLSETYSAIGHTHEIEVTGEITASSSSESAGSHNHGGEVSSGGSHSHTITTTITNGLTITAKGDTAPG